jgi:hypothetical protein
MGRWAASVFMLVLTAAVWPSGARAWVRIAPVVPPPASEPEAPPAAPVPPETIVPPETPPPADNVAPPLEPPAAVEEQRPLAPPAAPADWPPEETAILETPVHAPIDRPKLSAAVGMGGSFDAVGFDDGDVRAIPAFFTVLGIGDGLFGFNLGAFASEAAGRFGNQNPVDRLALDAYGVIRPGAWYRPDDLSYQMRVLRALAAELGLGFERDGRSAISGTRFVVHVGASVDLPLTPAHEATELRLRLAVRRGVGLYTPRLRGGAGSEVTNVGDSAAELYAALVVVF